MRQLIRILSGGIAVALLGVGLSACDPTESRPTARAGACPHCHGGAGRPE